MHSSYTHFSLFYGTKLTQKKVPQDWRRVGLMKGGRHLTRVITKVTINLLFFFYFQGVIPIFLVGNRKNYIGRRR